MRISSGQRLLIGSTTDDTTNKLQVTGSGTFTGSVTSSANFYTARDSDTLGVGSYSGGSFSIRNNVAQDFNIDIFNRTTSVWYNALKLNNNGGSATFSSSIQTSAPSGGTANPWKLGSVTSNVVAFDTSKYVQVEINGVAYRLALAL